LRKERASSHLLAPPSLLRAVPGSVMQPNWSIPGRMTARNRTSGPEFAAQAADSLNGVSSPEARAVRCAYTLGRDPIVARPRLRTRYR